MVPVFSLLSRGQLRAVSFVLEDVFMRIMREGRSSLQRRGTVGFLLFVALFVFRY